MTPAPLQRDGWRLEAATDGDLGELMGWFGGREDVERWGGPVFRFPFTARTFREDCHWGRMASFRLSAPDGAFAAFGQFYERYGRINFARLVAHPSLRSQGVGKRLLGLLMQAGAAAFDCDEFSLFVFRDNVPALECYKSVGFAIRGYPDDAPLADRCYYLTRPVDDIRQFRKGGQE